MAEKETLESAGVSHNEKSPPPYNTPNLAEAGGRRKSVALNIVENPLKVSLKSLTFRQNLCSYQALALMLLTIA